MCFLLFVPTRGIPEFFFFFHHIKKWKITCTCDCLRSPMCAKMNHVFRWNLILVFKEPRIPWVLCVIIFACNASSIGSALLTGTKTWYLDLLYFIHCCNTLYPTVLKARNIFCIQVVVKCTKKCNTFNENVWCQISPVVAPKLWSRHRVI